MQDVTSTQNISIFSVASSILFSAVGVKQIDAIYILTAAWYKKKFRVSLGLMKLPIVSLHCSNMVHDEILILGSGGQFDLKQGILKNKDSALE